MKPNLRAFDRLVRFLLGAFLIFAALVLFTHPLARVLATIAGIYALLECLTSSCPLYARLGMKSSADVLKSESLYLLGLLGVQGVLAYEWWNAGWGKVSSPDFVSGIAQTLGFFASKNPFPWYKDFLTGVAIPNAQAFAYTVEWSQVAIALVLAGSICGYLCVKTAAARRWVLILCALALLGGALMNANFYLAAGWTGPGTKGSNMVMFWSEMVLSYIWLSALLSRKKA